MFQKEFKMNEKLKELVKQAGLNIDGYGYPIWGSLDGEEEKKEFLEKFAELIIKECANRGSQAMSTDLEPDYVGRKIREYFGVK